jgi:hypothetical protein
MKVHCKTRSLVMVSPHTKLFSLNVQESRPINKGPVQASSKPVYDKKREILLFRLLKSSHPSNQNFSSQKAIESDPFRLPPKTRERQRRQYFNLGTGKKSEKGLTRKSSGLLSNNSESNRMNVEENSHFVKMFRVRPMQRLKEYQNDSALIISKKTILPIFSSRVVH